MAFTFCGVRVSIIVFCATDGTQHCMSQSVVTIATSLNNDCSKLMKRDNDSPNEVTISMHNAGTLMHLTLAISQNTDQPHLNVGSHHKQFDSPCLECPAMNTTSPAAAFNPGEDSGSGVSDNRANQHVA